MANIQALNKENHHHLTVEESTTYRHSKSHHMVPATLFELNRLAAEYPLAFVKDRETGQFHLVAMLGLQTEENLFYNDEEWQGNYVPMHLQAHPFILSNHPQEEDKQIVGIDLDSELVGTEHGNRLFDDNGEQTQLLQSKTDLLLKLHEQNAVVRAFITLLVEQDLLAPQSLNVQVNGQNYDLTGLYAIDENKLNQLDTDSFQILRERGALRAIYTCLFSMGRVENLARIKASKGS